ncbi:hypothetical protein BZARG_2224 [Bizionia argentinensis JUB59]|uniref:C-type lysozyme inhibitor domain-containing protein n=1 Tax=Bizionia argentinensis JUB59 TaxID=1046627 RepID=G2EGB6_9FLAO|nr:MliC family protein [Bizionia argentinensis]EGV42487.1 hypothetical protein BZARG_2224 [Bizionia argentinensis JUB59]
MKKIILTITLLTALIFTACKENSKQDEAITTTEEAMQNNDDIVKTVSTDKDGKTLELVFNNTENTTTLNFNGETITLEAQKAASGIWYKNENFELRGKGNNLELKKNGEVVFYHTDDIVTSSLKNKDGKTLDVTFNNTEGTAKVYLNDGEQIDLKAEKVASGIWYKNETYELRGKGNNLELKKDGNVVFEHTDDIVMSSVKDKVGQTLNMTFNNTEGTVKVYLNGGEQIDLEAQRAASGIWYKNETYELRGKGEHLELTKDGETVFKN